MRLSVLRPLVVGLLMVCLFLVPGVILADTDIGPPVPLERRVSDLEHRVDAIETAVRSATREELQRVEEKLNRAVTRRTSVLRHELARIAGPSPNGPTVPLGATTTLTREPLESPATCPCGPDCPCRNTSATDGTAAGLPAATKAVSPAAGAGTPRGFPAAGSRITFDDGSSATSDGAAWIADGGPVTAAPVTRYSQPVYSAPRRLLPFFGGSGGGCANGRCGR